MVDVKTRESSETSRVQMEGDLLPRQVHASFEYDLIDPSSTRENILGDLERYRHVYLKVMKVEKNNDEILIYYNIQYISTRISVGTGRLGLITDLSRVPDQIFPQDRKYFVNLAGERPLEDENFTGQVRFLHNENLFLAELIIRSMGVEVRNFQNDRPMEMVSMKILGTCPFCGTVCRGVSRCQTCHNDLPEEIGFRKLLKLHARRQYNDKLVAIRVSRIEPARKREMVAQTEARLRAIEDM